MKFLLALVFVALLLSTIASSLSLYKLSTYAEPTTWYLHRDGAILGRYMSFEACEDYRLGSMTAKVAKTFSCTGQ